MKIGTETENTKKILIPGLLFLLSMDLMNMSNYLLLIFVIICIFSSRGEATLFLNIELSFLILSFMCYFYIYQFYNTISPHTFVVFLFGPIAMYICGQIVISRINSVYFTTLVYTIAAGLFAHGMLNILYFSQNKIDRQTLNGRQILDVWGGFASATLQNTYFVMVIALLFFALFISNKFLERTIIISGCAFSVYASIITASRTILYLIVVVPLICLVLNYYLTKTAKNKFVKIVAVLLLITVFFVVAFSINLLGIQDWYKSTSLAKRIATGSTNTVIKDLRWEYSIMVLSGILDYPLGNNPIQHYAHNMWLDVARLTGIMPFFFLVIYSALTIKTMILFVTCENIDTKVKYIIFSIYTACFILFFIEPILEGIPHFFALFCFINGMTYKYLRISEKS